MCVAFLLPCCLYAEGCVTTAESNDSACMVLEVDAYEPEAAVCEYMESTAPMATSEQDVSIMLSKKPKDKSYKNTKYWKRHNTFKILGWSFLGVGVPAMVVGFALAVASTGDGGGTYNDDYDENGNLNTSNKSKKNDAPAAIPFFSGAALTVASIPMFILSATNKAKAKRVSASFVPMTDRSSGAVVPGLSLAMTF